MEVSDAWNSLFSSQPGGGTVQYMSLSPPSPWSKVLYRVHPDEIFNMASGQRCCPECAWEATSTLALSWLLGVVTVCFFDFLLNKVFFMCSKFVAFCCCLSLRLQVSIRPTGLFSNWLVVLFHGTVGWKKTIPFTIIEMESNGPFHVQRERKSRKQKESLTWCQRPPWRQLVH